jgi:hypothetical protein
MDIYNFKIHECEFYTRDTHRINLEHNVEHHLQNLPKVLNSDFASDHKLMQKY